MLAVTDAATPSAKVARTAQRTRRSWGRGTKTPTGRYRVSPCRPAVGRRHGDYPGRPGTPAPTGFSLRRVAFIGSRWVTAGGPNAASNRALRIPYLMNSARAGAGLLPTTATPPAGRARP